MRCSEFEFRVCDYLDGTLEQRLREEVDEHASGCSACAALLADSRALTAFLDAVPAIDAPANLAAQILNQTQGAPAALADPAGWRSRLRMFIEPRFVMSMALTILSFSMLARFAGLDVRQVDSADLSPAAVWQGIDNQAHRIWDRGVKYYGNIRFVYEIVSQLRSFETSEEPAQDTEEPAADSRRIEPAKKK